MLLDYPYSLGACCIGTECVMTTSEGLCTMAEGVWYEGETCPEFECPILCFEFLPGDCNMANGGWPPGTIGGDVTYLVNYFRGMSSSQSCLISDGFWCSADVNGDCNVIGSDVTKLVNFFRGTTTLEWCPERCDEPCYPVSPYPVDPPPGWPNCQP